MKIAFVQPRSFHSWEALNIGYLSSYLRIHGDHDLVFYSGFFDSDAEIINGCQDAEIIGFSCTSPQVKHALQLGKEIKHPRNHIVFGGTHPSSLPQATLMNDCVDAVVVGEGEQAFLDIVKGDRSQVVQRPYIQNLDSIPFPDRKLIKQERNIHLAYVDNGERIASIFSSRGCPFRCVFCASHTVWSRKARYRSPTNVLAEFQQVVSDLNIDFIKFADDTFALKKSLVMDFCRQKIERNITTEWGCNLRVDTVDEEMLHLMRQAGCREIWAGVESGSPRILKDMQKGITVDKIRWAFKVTRELGFFRRAYVLLGMPNESYYDIKLTEDLIDEIEPDMVGFTILAPYPGTMYYDAHLHANVDWSTVDEYENRMTCTAHLSNEDLHREQKRLTEKYLERLAYRNRQIRARAEKDEQS